MAMSTRLSEYLEKHSARYELCTHPHSRTSAETARTAHVPMHALAKSVILEDDAGMVMAVLPADRQVHLGKVTKLLGRNLRLSTEDRISGVFSDCEIGALPPCGMAWGIETLVDESLEMEPEVYAEAGDHECLLHFTGEQFSTLMDGVRHANFAEPLAPH